MPAQRGKGPDGSAGKDGAETAGKGKAESVVKKTGTPTQGQGTEAGAGSGTGSAGVANPDETHGSTATTQARLLKEAADALKALALRSMKYSKVEFMEPAERTPGLLCEMAFYQRPVIRLSLCGHQGEMGLLDSGASVCLRPPKPGELECSAKRSVQLAVGQKEMWTSSLGTILDEAAKEPIVSLPQLVAIGYHVRWGSQGMILTDRKNHRVPVQSQGGCPEVSKDCALRVIAEIEEQLAKGKQARSRVAKLLESNPHQTPKELLNNLRKKLSEGKEAHEELRLWLAKVFPDAPADLLDKVSASPSLVGEEAPWNRRQRRTMLLAKGGILVNLFAGHWGSVSGGSQ